MKKIPDNQIAFYQSQDGSVNIEVMYAGENILPTQKKMAELFDCSTDNVSLHLKNIYKERELDQSSTAEDFSVVQKMEIKINRSDLLRILTLTLKNSLPEIHVVFHELNTDKLSPVSEKLRIARMLLDKK